MLVLVQLTACVDLKKDIKKIPLQGAVSHGSRLVDGSPITMGLLHR